MDEAPDNVFCAEHAFKHGIAAEDIEYAWLHFLRKLYRGKPHDGEIIAIGYSQKGQLIEMVAVQRPCGTLIYHAMAPPTKSMLKELGLGKRSNYENTQ